MAAEWRTRWILEAVGTLDRSAFMTSLPPQTASAYSLTFWFCAAEARRKQVIIRIEGLLEINLENDALTVECDVPPVMLSVPAPALAVWHHVAVVMDDTARLYVDGDLVCAQSVSGVTDTVHTARAVCIGGYTDPAGGHFDYTFGRNHSGWVDDVRWYDEPLTPADPALRMPAAVHVPAAQFEARAAPGGQVACTVITAQPDAFRMFLWDFGDQDSGTGADVSHTYAFDGVYTIRLTAVTTSYQPFTCEQTFTVQGAAPRLAVVPVFVNASEGHACYRIPSIVRAANGDLVAFAEARLESCSDSTATIRLVCKRSSDGGQTWSSLQVVARNLVQGQEYAVQNSAPVVDTVRGTGRIVVLYNKLENAEWALAEGTGTSRICCSISDDHGQTWNSETDVTAHVHRPGDWRVQRPTLGHAIQLTSGRLLFAGVFTAGARSVFQSQNYVFWSDDLGASWTMGPAVPYIGLNEAMAVELENGDIMLNSRAYHDETPVGRRAVTVGRFMDSDTLVFGPTRFDAALICPAVQASIMRCSTSRQAEYGGKSRLLFANPAHTHARYNLTVRLSYDEGQTWAVSRTADSGPSAYSDLVMQADGRIGVLYERGNQGGIAYVSFTLDWLTDGQDRLGS